MSDLFCHLPVLNLKTGNTGEANEQGIDFLIYIFCCASIVESNVAVTFA
ncbi:hypothetical protein MTBPR1_140048 [Candidatus Terasakiella magnetica]|uniref:Uncharacterized protein n=1 Tax=Candidatus Terasakiella magnetica TaxID=1867952 RepID=A0A1C3RF70_9PROT|nr:hypothetical protein MTBPR1_140048 [Candidatus Terasakiella magnetica]